MTATRWPEARAPRGMVATPHLLATQSGVAALRAGGNALDAAIAAAATIAVVYPHMNGLGGDNVWLIYDAAPAAPARALRRWAAPRARPRIDWYAARGITQAPSRRAAGPPRSPCPRWWTAGGRRTEYSRATMGSPLGWKALLADAIAVRARGLPGLRRPAHPAAARARSLHRARARGDPPRALAALPPDALAPRAARAARPRPHARGGARRRAPRRSTAATSPGASWRRPPRRAARSPSRTWPSIARTGWSRCASPTRKGRPRASRRRPRASRRSRCWA